MAAVANYHDVLVGEPILYQVVRDRVPCEWQTSMTEEEKKIIFDAGAVQYCLTLALHTKDALSKKGFRLLSWDSLDGQNVYALVSKNGDSVIPLVANTQQ